MNTLLLGITRRGSRQTPPTNPGLHSPLAFQNRIAVEVLGPDGPKARIAHTGNVLCTWGLNQLIEQLVSGSNGFATDWVNRLVVATGTDAVASTVDILTGSTGAVVLGGGSMVASDAGARTLQYNATMINTDAAYTIGSVGLFGSTANTASMVAGVALGTTVGKATNDTVNITYQVIAGTAA